MQRSRLPQQVARTRKKQKKPRKTGPFCSHLLPGAKPCQVAKYPLGESNNGIKPRERKSETPVQGGTVCGTVDAQNPPLDPQLQLLIERWPTLSKAVQQQIMLLVG